jgi:putative ABC transport system permease protein
MSSSYVKFLSKNRLFTAIEVFGLSIALGFVILLASYARTEFSVGARQPHSKQLYAIGTEDMIGLTLGAGEEFFPSMPEITSWTRVAVIGDADITVDGQYFSASACALDTNFPKIA